MSKITFIVWAPYQRRAEILAEHLGASVEYLYYRPANKLLSTPVGYVVQALRTWRALRQAHPGAIFVENPPIFAALVVSVYARRYGASYVIDSHTGAFVSPKWRWSLWIHRLLSRGALATIVHNTSQEKIVERWRCRYMVIGFTPGSYPRGEDATLDGQFNVAVVSSFREDEPLDAVFEAAALLPEVSFYVTGDSTRIEPSLLPKKPGNCVLTGYLSYQRYVGFLRAADAIMVLTKRNHTLLMGAFEGVSLARPLIVSDWPILRDYFPLGTVHVANTAEGICEGVRRARREHADLERGILELKSQREVEWGRKLEELREVLSGALAEQMAPKG